MMTEFTFLLLGCAGAAVAGCASNSGTGQVSTPSTSMTAPAASPVTSVTGTWTGWAGVGARDTPVTMTLTQTGANVAGDVTVGGRPDLSGRLIGLVQGNGIHLSLAAGYGSLPEMTVSQNQIFGNLGGLPFSLQRAR
jgi:hypothetical protein